MAIYEKGDVQIEDERRTGAMVCMAALPDLLRAATEADDDQDAAGYYGKQQIDAAAFVAKLGTFPPHVEGIILALAEYLHASESMGGTPDLETWAPCAAQGADALTTKAQDMQEWIDSSGRSQAGNVISLPTHR